MVLEDERDSKIIWNDINLEPISWELKSENQLFNICVGVWVRGQDAAKFSHISKDAHKNSASFDINVVVVGDGANMVLNEKPTKNQKLRGLKLRGLMWNQISTPDFAYQNDQRNKIYTLGDFEKKTPTHMVATHAISKSQQNFQNRIPRELDKNFYIPRISMIYWISSNFLKLKNRPQKKVISIPNPGIQPSYGPFGYKLVLTVRYGPFWSKFVSHGPFWSLWVQIGQSGLFWLFWVQIGQSWPGLVLFDQNSSTFKNFTVRCSDCSVRTPRTAKPDVRWTLCVDPHGMSLLKFFEKIFVEIF